MKSEIKKQKFKAVLLVILMLTITLIDTSCNKEEDDGAGYSFTYTLHKNPQNLDPQLATDKSSLMIIKNMFLGLITFNADGNLICGVAKDYTISEDGLKYTFTLRDDCYWYDSGEITEPVTAHDFVYAFKRIFNPVTQSPYREKFSFIQNASKIINGELDYSQLGVYATNNNELVFYLDKPDTEFLYLLTTAPAMPCNKEFFEGTKARYGLDDESVISNGAFYMTQWSYDPYGTDNLIYMKRNFNNSENDKIYPYMITFRIEREKDMIFENFDSELSECMVSEEKVKKKFMDIYNSDSHQTSSVGIIFNDGYEISENIKKALLCCIDREGLESEITDKFDPAYGIVPESINFLNMNFREKNPEEMLFADMNAVYSLSEQDREQFYKMYPEGVKILVESESDGGVMNHISTLWQDKLGIYIGIDYVDSESYHEKLENNDYIMALVEISSDDKSLYYFLKNAIQMIPSQDKQVLEEKMETARRSSDYNEAFNIYSGIEREILESGNYIPLLYKKVFLVYRDEVKDMIFNPFSEQIDFRYAKYFG